MGKLETLTEKIRKMASRDAISTGMTGRQLRTVESELNELVRLLQDIKKDADAVSRLTQQMTADLTRAQVSRGDAERALANADNAAHGGDAQSVTSNIHDTITKLTTVADLCSDAGVDAKRLCEDVVALNIRAGRLQ